MERKLHISPRRKAQLRYAFFDVLSAEIVWLLFLTFRWLVYDGRIFSVDDVLIPAFNFVQPLVLYPLGCLCIHYLSGFYLQPHRKTIARILLPTFASAIVISLGAFFLIISDDEVDTFVHYYGSLLALFLFQFFVTLLSRLIISLCTRPRPKQTLIIGSKESAASLQTALVQEDIVGILDIEKKDEAVEMVRRREVDSVVIAIDHHADEGMLYQLTSTFFSLGAEIRFMPSLYDILMGSARITSIKASPLVSLTEHPMSDSGVCIKRAFDICFSALALVVLSPIYLVLAIGVRLSSQGPIIYSQERIGLHAKPFRIYKFRSMVVGAEEHGPKLCDDDDPRITPFGRFIRKYRLDELPQFWNILKGDMSIVGPRPERRFFIDEIEKEAPYYCLIYKIRPGLTSWGPIRVGYTDSIEKMVERLRYDIIYMENMSLLLDCKIMLSTIGIIIDGKGK